MTRLAVLLSFSMGLLSLSQEIAWVRLVSFGHQGRPHAFAIVLVAFLLGIAAGALLGRRYCRDERRMLPAVAAILALAAMVDMAALRLAPFLMGQQATALLSLMLLIGVCALLKGLLFPIVHHLGAADSSEGLGRSVSRVYAANVLGSALGPAITGLLLLDHLTVEQVFSLVSLCTAGLAVWVHVRQDGMASGRHALPSVLALLLASANAVHPPRALELIALQDGGQLRHLIQNKHGVIHVMASTGDSGGDITLGNNLYDGRLNVDMRINSNKLDRAYLLATLHPRPSRVLVIGLSTGAWTQALAGMPGVQRIDVVEINPAYLDLIRQYAVVSPILADPRVHIHIDDGRRWLRRHEAERFDLVVMNTTFHWRAYASLLLSKEFMQLVDSRLAPGGIFAFNTTGSLDAFHTASTVFPAVGRYLNFAYASHQPLTALADAEQRLRDCRLHGQAAFPADLFVPGAIGERLARGPLVPAEQDMAGRPAEVITELNMLTEYRHGMPPLAGLLKPWLPPTPLDQSTGASR
ncbi:MAG: fused MFS/spermidine synthase [Roseateles sp.]